MTGGTAQDSKQGQSRTGLAFKGEVCNAGGWVGRPVRLQLHTGKHHWLRPCNKNIPVFSRSARARPAGSGGDRKPRQSVCSSFLPLPFAS